MLTWVSISREKAKCAYDYGRVITKYHGFYQGSLALHIKHAMYITADKCMRHTGA